jgi:hypothetical protein
MHAEFLLEERSAEAALIHLLPKLMPAGSSWTLHAFQGKPDLLGKLPGLLRGYARWLSDDYRIVVLVDADEDDCRALKERLERTAAAEGLLTKTAAPDSGRFAALNRIAVEELEAWFIGDVEALADAYPGVPRSLDQRRRFRDPDGIRGTWEALERVLQDAGHFRSGLRKIEAAGHIAARMDPTRNRSRSFRCFAQGLAALGETGV